MAFTIQRYEDLRAGVVGVDGDIDMATVPPLQASLDALVESGYVNVVLDLHDVRYADSSALGMLVWLDRRLRDVDGKVVLAGANRDIRRVLAISRIASVADTLCESDTVDAALLEMEPVGRTENEEWIEEIDMPAEVGMLAEVRESVCALIEPLGFPEAALFDIKVALGEALANAVRHGSPQAGGSVSVRVRGFADKVVVEVRDTGHGFDGDHACSDDLYASGGRGIMFMRALMDQVAFEQAGSGGTTVTLVKHRAPVEAAD